MDYWPVRVGLQVGGPSETTKEQPPLPLLLLLPFFFLILSVSFAPFLPTFLSKGFLLADVQKPRISETPLCQGLPFGAQKGTPVESSGCPYSWLSQLMADPHPHPTPISDCLLPSRGVFYLKFAFLQVGPFAQEEHLSFQSMRAKCGKCVCMCG